MHGDKMPFIDLNEVQKTEFQFKETKIILIPCYKYHTMINKDYCQNICKECN